MQLMFFIAVMKKIIRVDFDYAVGMLKMLLRAGDLLLTMSAGNVYQLEESLCC